MTPPSGRAKKPTAKPAKDISDPASGSASGKNTPGNTNAAAKPKMAKSNCSSMVPKPPAITAMRMFFFDLASAYAC
jgi:hypothetical protein